MTESLAEQVVQPTYEQVIAGIKHSGVQEILRHAKDNEQRLASEFERLEENADLNDEARERLAEDAINRFVPKIDEAYKSAREKVTASAESQYRFSLPFPDGRTFNVAQAKDTQELLAVQGEADAIAQKITGAKSLEEATRAVSKNPRDKGVQQRSDPRMDALRKEFDQAMAEGGLEGRVRAMAIARVCDRMGIALEQVVEHHRTDVHYRALEDERRFTRAAFTLPKGKRVENPFSAKRRGSKAVGTYRSGNKAMLGGKSPLFQNQRRKRAWK